MLAHGHALFENGQIRDGYILHLDQHLERLFSGVKKIHLESQMKWTKEDIKSIITECVSRSGVRNGAFRYYLSAGIEGRPNFYAMVEEGIPVKPIEGCKDL